MTAFSLQGKRVGVMGWGRSGRAAAELAGTLGGEVFISESRPRDGIASGELAGIDRWKSEFGGHTRALLDTDILILSPGIPQNIGALSSYEGEIWSEIELGYRVTPCPIVAVTGSNGKSTTATLIHAILSANFTSGRTFLLGNIGQPLSSAALDMNENDVCVLEVSSFQLETIRKFHPLAAVWLNLFPNHLDRYPDFNTYAEAKKRVFMNMNGNDLAVICIDDPVSAELAASLKGPEIRTISEKSGRRLPEGVLSGVKSSVNLRAAAAVCRKFGVTEAEAMRTAAEFRGLPHRIERLGEVHGVTFINDSKATNAAAVNAAISSISPPITLILGGKDKGEDYSSIDTSKCARVVAYGAAADRISASLNCEIVRDFDNAVQRAFQLSAPGGAVLLSPACSSYDSFRSFEERGDRFRTIFQSMLTPTERTSDIGGPRQT